MSEQDVLVELKEMFQFVMPDAHYLETDPDAKEHVDEINQLIDDNTSDIREQISALHAYNSDWFPDELDEEEQEEYQKLLDAAEEYM